MRSSGLFYFNAAFFFAALLVSFAVTPLMRKIAFRLGAVDRGAGRRVHKGIVPRLGGGGIYLAFVLPLALGLSRGSWGTAHVQMAGILAGATIIFLLGAWDDLKGAPIANKLAAEIAAASLIWLWGIRIETLSNPFGGPIELGWASLPVTVLWVVVITNAINLVDGLDGLAATTGILITGALLLFAPGQRPVFTLACVVLIGALLGFLVHNFPPATIFMGDSGSLLTGFVLAAFSILTSSKATAMAAVMLPIVAFAHPLMDMIYAVLRRYHRGLPLGTADKEHIHHKLLEMGFSKRAVLLILTVLNVSLAVAVLLFLRLQQGGKYLVPMLLTLLVLAGLRFFGYVRLSTFTGDNLRLLVQGRQRRYGHFVVRRLMKRASEAEDVDGLRDAVAELAQECGVGRVRLLIMEGGIEKEAFTVELSRSIREPVRLEFPVSTGGREIGEFQLVSEMGSDTFLETGELILALSGAVDEYFGRVRRGG